MYSLRSQFRSCNPSVPITDSAAPSLSGTFTNNPSCSAAGATFSSSDNSRVVLTPYMFGGPTAFEAYLHASSSSPQTFLTLGSDSDHQITLSASSSQIVAWSNFTSSAASYSTDFVHIVAVFDTDGFTLYVNGDSVVFSTCERRSAEHSSVLPSTNTAFSLAGSALVVPVKELRQFHYIGGDFDGTISFLNIFHTAIPTAAESLERFLATTPHFWDLRACNPLLPISDAHSPLLLTVADVALGSCDAAGLRFDAGVADAASIDSWAFGGDISIAMTVRCVPPSFAPPPT